MHFITFLTMIMAAESCAGQLSGTVRDPAGKPIPAATLSVRSRDNSNRWNTLSDTGGAYRFAGIPPGDYLLEGMAEEFGQAIEAIVVGAGRSLRQDVTLPINRVRSSVVVTATQTAQSMDEVAKAVDVLTREELDARAESSVVESLQTVPGLRVQTLGGPGSFSRILTRGLRAQDTALTVDGLRFRDAATTQGDATTFLENLFLVDTERIEVERGTASSVYGTGALGGVVNVVTDEGGGAMRGQVLAEGGGLGLMRGAARFSGGSLADRLRFSGGAQHVNVTRGVDGDDRFRNSSLQGRLQYRPNQSTSLSGRVWFGDGFVGINDTPFAAPAALLPATGSIPAVAIPLATQRAVEAGAPLTYPNGANFVPNLNDPDSRRASRFWNSALLFNHSFNARVSARASYQRVVTRRRFMDGPLGVRSEPRYTSQDLIRGGIDTLQARTDIQMTRTSLLSGGYEFEAETYRSASRNFFVPASSAIDYRADAKQRSNTAFLHSQNRFFGDRLHVSLSARVQAFSLDKPSFTGGSPVYRGLSFDSPGIGRTGDVAAAWFQASTGTKIRAHVGNGYRAPSIYERFGASFFDGAFTANGDPRLRPESTIGLDWGIDQYFARQTVRVSATQFYTDLRELIAFDSSGFLSAATDPFRRSSGYINTGGGIARGVEFSVEVAVRRSTRLLGSYTFTNSSQRRSTVVGNDFFRTNFIAQQQATFVATRQITKRIHVSADGTFASAHPNVISRRAFLFPGARKVDLVGGYTLPLSERHSARFYAKLNNIFHSQYFENGFRSAGFWGTAGIEYAF